MGARPMARLIQEKLKKEIAEDILFGKLSENGGDVYVSLEGGEISLEVKGRKSKEKEKKELSQVRP